jgi:hypothetical protein
MPRPWNGITHVATGKYLPAQQQVQHQASSFGKVHVQPTHAFTARLDAYKQSAAVLHTWHATTNKPWKKTKKKN